MENDLKDEKNCDTELRKSKERNINSALSNSTTSNNSATLNSAASNSVILKTTVLNSGVSLIKKKLLW